MDYELKNIDFAFTSVTDFRSNAGLVWCKESKQAALIDPGGDAPALLKMVRQHDVKPVAIWLTHGHLDHVAAAPEMKREFGIDIIGPHRDDRDILLRLEDMCKAFDQPIVQGFEPDKWLEDGDELKLGDHKFSVVHTPGHSPGSVVFHCAAENFQLVGDVIFRGSVGRVDLPGGDAATLQHSIMQKLLPLGDATKFHPGHGEGSTLGHERETNPFLLAWR